MERIPNQNPITDDSTITKTDGNTLKYWELRSDLVKYFQRDKNDFFLSERYQDTLEDLIVMLLGREKIVPLGGQIKGNYKAIFDKLLDDFRDPYKFIIKKESPKRDLPLFRDLPKEDTRPDAN